MRKFYDESKIYCSGCDNVVDDPKNNCPVCGRRPSKFFGFGEPPATCFIATSFPKKVECFIWYGNEEGLPAWMDEFDGEEFIGDYGAYRIDEGSYVVRGNQYIEIYSYEEAIRFFNLDGLTEC